MSTTLVPPRLSSSAPSLVKTSRALLAVLLVTEGILLTHRFQVPRFSSAGPWWGLPLAHARALLIPGLLAAGTMAFLGGARPIWGMSIVGLRSRPGLGLAVAVHLAAFAVFVAWTAEVFEGDALTSRWPAAWVLGWYGSGLAVVATWLAAWQTLGWRGFWERRKLGTVAIGIAVGVEAFACSQFAGHLWGPMAAATLVIVRGCLSLVASNIVSDPAMALIGVDDFAVVIAPACSGYEGIGLVWTFLAVYLVAFRRSLRWPRAWWLIPLGTIAIWLVNAARIMALVLIGAWVSPQVALAGFHSQAGSLGILTISLGLVALSRRTRCFAADRAAVEVEEADVAPVAHPAAA